jgi:hypothetical protein
MAGNDICIALDKENLPCLAYGLLCQRKPIKNLALVKKKSRENSGI